jgi:putative transposase
MKKNTVVELSGRASVADPLTEIVRQGAKQLIQQAVEAEHQELLMEHADHCIENRNVGVVRNGYLPERQLQTGIGPVMVQIPKVRSRIGEPVTFRSALVQPYVGKSKSIEAALPWLYLKGVSLGEMSEALKVLVAPDAEGLSASTVSRLKQVWALEYHSWSERRLDNFLRAKGGKVIHAILGGFSCGKYNKRCISKESSGVGCASVAVL